MDEGREEIAELEEDDRDANSDVLGDIGIIGRHSLSEVVPAFSKFAKVLHNPCCLLGSELCCSVIGDRLSKLSGFLSDGTSLSTESLSSWQEDMHWLLLLIGLSREFIFQLARLNHELL